MSQTKLKIWMDEHGYSNSALAQELGLSYDYIYKLAVYGDRQITDSFKFRFLERFGVEEANKVFYLNLPRQAA